MIKPMVKQYGRADLARIAAKAMVDRRLTAEHIGQKVKARLTLADVERGFIDFEEIR
jgi:hypothetical protein